MKRNPAARDHLLAARARYEREGIPFGEGRKCDEDHNSGTRLPNCVKVYVPRPGSAWRMVFQFAMLADGRISIEYLAAGLGHTPREGRRLDVYKVAHQRLHGEWPPRR
ncbi:MAG: hypothetical protein ACRDK4_08080 [Solirubrobacteraceae bacterium]